MSSTLHPGNIGGLRIQRVKEQHPHLNMLIYGDVGVGKTWLSGSSSEVPELRPVLFIDVEGGTFTLRELFPDVEVVRVTCWDDLQKVYDELFEGLHQYQTVVIDSLTELQVFNMDEIMKSLLERDPDRFERQGDGDIPSMLEWQRNTKQLRKFVRAFRDLPITTIFTCLMKEDKHKITGKVRKKPSLPGKLADGIAGMFDIVVYLYLNNIDGEEKRLLLTEATELVTAKDRSNKLPRPVMVEPTMKDIYKYAVKGTQQ